MLHDDLNDLWAGLRDRTALDRLRRGKVLRATRGARRGDLIQWNARSARAHDGRERQVLVTPDAR
jgi:hypothetical protein